MVVVRRLAGEFAGIHGWTPSVWFGNQGFEYLDLGRFWQVLLSLGLLFWVGLLFRVLRCRLRTEHPGKMPWMFFYAVGLLARLAPHPHRLLALLGVDVQPRVCPRLLRDTGREGAQKDSSGTSIKSSVPCSTMRAACASPGSTSWQNQRALASLPS